MTTRLPEPTAFKDPQEQEFMHQLLRVLRNSLGDQEADIQNNQSSTTTSIEDLQTQLDGYVTNSDRGDITTSAGFATWTIDPDTVTFPKMQNIDTDKLLGRFTDGTGDVEQVTCTDFAQDLLDDADATAGRSTLGLGSAAVATLIDDDTFATATSANIPSAESVKAYVDAFAIKAVYLSHTEAVNTAGPTYTSGAYRTITIDTEDADPSNIATLSGNQVTLDAGTYLVFSRFSVSGSAGNLTYKIRLRNVTDNTTALVGPTVFQTPNQSVDGNPPMFGIFTVGASKALELQARFSTNTTAVPAANFTESEVFAQLVFVKLA